MEGNKALQSLLVSSQYNSLDPLLSLQSIPCSSESSSLETDRVQRADFRFRVAQGASTTHSKMPHPIGPMDGAILGDPYGAHDPLLFLIPKTSTASMLHSLIDGSI